MTPTPTENLNALAAEIKVTFPPGARLVGIGRERGIDDLVEAKVEMDAKGLAAFLARAPLKETDLEPGRRDVLGVDHDWWDPGRSKNLRAGQALIGNGQAFNLGVADGPPGRVVLYIVQHGT